MLNSITLTEEEARIRCDDLDERVEDGLGCMPVRMPPSMVLNMIAQIVITYHNDHAGKPLIDHTCHSDASDNPSNKIMVFLRGLAQFHQLCEILRRALDFGWTWRLIPLPFHGQSADECTEAVFSDPSLLALSGKCPLGKNPGIYDEEVFRDYEAPWQVQEIWAPYREPRYVRSCIVCTNVAESGVTIGSNVALVISSGVQRRVPTDIRTGSTVNALQTLSKAQLVQQQGRTVVDMHPISETLRRSGAMKGNATWICGSQ